MARQDERGPASKPRQTPLGHCRFEDFDLTDAARVEVAAI
jgi:hypothetical protein